MAPLPLVGSCHDSYLSKYSSRNLAFCSIALCLAFYIRRLRKWTTTAGSSDDGYKEPMRPHFRCQAGRAAALSNTTRRMIRTATITALPITSIYGHKQEENPESPQDIECTSGACPRCVSANASRSLATRCSNCSDSHPYTQFGSVVIDPCEESTARYADCLTLQGFHSIRSTHKAYLPFKYVRQPLARPFRAVIATGTRRRMALAVRHSLPESRLI